MSDSPRLTRAGNVAVDNSHDARRAKVELRQWVLREVQPARVIDVFAGDGEMYRDAWSKAAEYLGFDERPIHDARSLMIGDSYQLLRAIDLRRWNVFDVDCYGQPWQALLIIAARRQWAAGEIGAVVCTDSSLRTKFGFASHAQVAANGLDTRIVGKTTASDRDSMTSLGIARWSRSAGVTINAMRRAASTRSSGMSYYAIVFSGNAD